MCKMYLLSAILLTIFAKIDSIVAPAGKCNLYDVTVFPLDFDTLEKISQWEYLYATDGDLFCQIDHERVELTTIDADRNYRTDDTKFMKDKTKSNIRSTYKVKNNIGFERSVNEKGKVENYRIYPLAKTFSDAVLFYRCSDTGTADIDTRFIICPAGRNVTDEELGTLFEADKVYPFRGRLYRLPRQYK